MAKPLVLSEDTLAAPQPQPRAAQAAPVLVEPGKAAKPPKPPKVELVPLQIRIPAKDMKAIKIAAVEAGQTVSDFMLACFHGSMK